MLAAKLAELTLKYSPPRPGRCVNSIIEAATTTDTAEAARRGDLPSMDTKRITPSRRDELGPKKKKHSLLGTVEDLRLVETYSDVGSHIIIHLSRYASN